MPLHYNYSASKKQPEELWQALRSGEKNAINHIFLLFYDSLCDYGIKIAGDEETVKDGIQDLFLRLWNRRQFLGDAASVNVYLLASLRRILLRDKERKRKQQEYNKQYTNETFDLFFSEEDIMANAKLKNERRKLLLDAINQLNNRQKEALFLRYYHGLTNQEIASVMEINHQSVRNHLARALANLRVLLKKKDYENNIIS